MIGSPTQNERRFSSLQDPPTFPAETKPGPGTGVIPNRRGRERTFYRLVRYRHVLVQTGKPLGDLTGTAFLHLLRGVQALLPFCAQDRERQVVEFRHQPDTDELFGVFRYCFLASPSRNSGQGGITAYGFGSFGFARSGL